MTSITSPLSHRNLCHELRTPLTGILGGAALLRYGKLNKKQREHVEIIQQSGQRLLQFINTLLFSNITTSSDSETSETTDFTIDAKTATKPSVLLVEDEPIVQKTHQNMLEQLGFHVDIASKSTEVFAMLQDKHCAIFMDMGLPGMTGLEITKKIRAEYHRHIPILMLTAYQVDEIKNDCIAAGVDAIVIKPVEIDTLKNLLEKYTLTLRS